ncbi:hypothetical protein [Alkalihalobacillus sp. TS-13]|uniref:hypothetical protein n=1 Tax=Alkalihalobacillus sp. TS-13 TaxID=2842455 RepID=UPI001C8772B6|nr:hypothetical protein [Alkalihalobacillus sp. TS-13]
MTRKIIWCVIGVVVLALLVAIFLPAVTLHFGKSYGGQVYGFEKGEEDHYAEQPGDNWEISFYAVTFHHEDMYTDPQSVMVINFKNDDPPIKFTYSVEGTDVTETIDLHHAKAFVQLPQKSVEPFLYDLYEQGPHSTLKVKIHWNDQQETIELPFLTSFSRRQFPWYLKFMERELR